LALLLPAVAKVRELALRSQSMNNLRQISLAIQQFEDTRGSFPSINGKRKGPNPRQSLWFAILPYLEHGNLYREVEEGRRQYSSDYTLKVYLSPADPTLRGLDNEPGMLSYAANAQVFSGTKGMSTYVDGASNTIAIAEHYAFNCRDTQFNWYWFASPHEHFAQVGLTEHRGTFADFDPGTPDYQPDLDDVYPITKGNPPQSVGSLNELTFQTRPRIRDCDPRIAQTPHSGGMLVALGDGSVRILSGGMSSNTYWAAVTPAAGDVLGPDW
jgi:hypothetical protein